MAFIRSQVFFVFVAVCVVLFCVDLAYRVEGDTMLRLANIGDDITLSCYRPYNYMSWFRNGTLIANYVRVVINDSRFTQGVTYNGYPDSNKIHISNISMNDSATFQCRDFYDVEIISYDLRVIKCSNCIIATHSHPDKIKVICTLDNYWARLTLSKYILLNGSKHWKAAFIEGNTISFSITLTELNRHHSEFDLQIEVETRITCMQPTQSTPQSFPTTTLSTTSLRQTTQNRPQTLSYTASKQLPAGRSTSISTTRHHTPKNKNTSSDKNTRDGNITLIIVILSSVIILMLIVIIVLRCKKTKDRQENKHTGNASIEKETPKVYYESVEDGSQNGPEYTTSIKELRETSLDQQIADHEDTKEHPEVCYESIEDGSQKSPEYATSIMELNGTSRESKSTSDITGRSSNSDHLYDNSAIITQQELNRNTLQQGDQYENVKMPGSGDDAEEIPLYDMPDKGPTRNTLETTPEAGQTPTLSKDEVVSVDPLYIEIY